MLAVFVLQNDALPISIHISWCIAQSKGAATKQHCPCAQCNTRDTHTHVNDFGASALCVCALQVCHRSAETEVTHDRTEFIHSIAHCFTCVHVFHVCRFFVVRLSTFLVKSVADCGETINAYWRGRRHIAGTCHRQYPPIGW